MTLGRVAAASASVAGQPVCADGRQCAVFLPHPCGSLVINGNDYAWRVDVYTGNVKLRDVDVLQARGRWHASWSSGLSRSSAGIPKHHTRHVAVSVRTSLRRIRWVLLPDTLLCTRTYLTDPVEEFDHVLGALWVMMVVRSREDGAPNACMLAFGRPHPATALPETRSLQVRCSSRWRWVRSMWPQGRSCQCRCPCRRLCTRQS